MIDSTVAVLWAVNIPLPAASTALDLSAGPFGSWLSTMIARLAQVRGIRLGVAMRAPVAQVRWADVDGVRYYALPQTGASGLDARPQDCQTILEDFKPNILHASGSEMAYTRRMLEQWRGPRVLSLQGVVNGIEPFHLGGLESGRWSNWTWPPQALALLAMRCNHHLRFKRRLKDERAILNLTDHVIGRTAWDRAHAWALNSKARYFHCGEGLREEFLTRQWDLSGVCRNSLFIGSGAAPLKGAHVLLDAISRLRPHYPDLSLRIAGGAPSEQRSGFRRSLGYLAYLRSRIRQLNLEDVVSFTGVLDAEQMSVAMQQSHVFVLPSLIENSPNTLGEAMALGMPCVSAFAGGAPDMAVNESEALFYRPEDAVMLAWQIKRLFDSDELCVQLGAAARTRALKNHDSHANLNCLLRVYSEILGREVGHGG